MKALIIFLISFNSHAYFMTKEDFLSCQQGGNSHVFHVHKKTCKGECVEIPDANCPIFDLEDELVNGDPVYSAKENVTECETEEACEQLRSSLCSDLSEYQFFYAENLVLSGFEAYCTKITGYEKVRSERKILKENAQKKAAHLAKIEQAKIELEAKKIEEQEIQEELRKMARERIKLRKK